MWIALALSALVVVHNNIANRWGPFHGAAYVPINLTFAGIVTVLAVIGLEISAADLGLRPEANDLLLPVALVGLFGLGALALALSPMGRLIADERVAGMRGTDLAFYVLVRIPLGTALVEEFLFRGILFTAWREAGTTTLGAGLWASIAFGLWHIAPTAIGVRMNDPHASEQKMRAAVLAAAVATTVAGLGLTWLRVWSENLWAPIVLHAGINSLGALAAFVALRRMKLHTVGPTKRRS